MSARALRNVEALAWGILLAFFAVFLAALFGVPLVIAQYARSATHAEGADVESQAGAVMLISTDGITKVLAAGQRKADVPEGITVTTYPDAHAYVRLFDDNVVNLSPNTSLGLLQMRQPRFKVGTTQRRIQLYLDNVSGREAGLTIGSSRGDRQFEVDTPFGRVELAPESHAKLDLTQDALKVVGVDGSTMVTAAGKSVPVADGQLTTVRAGLPPDPPGDARENVVANADFDPPVTTDGPWKLVYYPLRDRSLEPGSGTGERSDDGRNVLRFYRQGSKGAPADIYFQQQLNRELSDATYLGVSADLRVLNQDLPGGGDGLTEFPVILSLVADDTKGNEFAWDVGFYATPPRADDRNLSKLAAVGQKVDLGQWHHFDTGNLLDSANPWGFTTRGFDRPLQLKRVLVKASGHDYISEVDDVGVWVK